jgi:hypothetical protein
MTESEAELRQRIARLIGGYERGGIYRRCSSMALYAPRLRVGVLSLAGVPRTPSRAPDQRVGAALATIRELEV